MNGIDPVLIATGNDWRAVEAGVHAYAARNGSYQAITRWRYQNKILTGVINCSHYCWHSRGRNCLTSYCETLFTNDGH